MRRPGKKGMWKTFKTIFLFYLFTRLYARVTRAFCARFLSSLFASPPPLSSTHAHTVTHANDRRRLFACDMRAVHTVMCAFESPLLLSFISRFRFRIIIVIVVILFLSYSNVSTFMCRARGYKTLFKFVRQTARACARDVEILNTKTYRNICTAKVLFRIKTYTQCRCVPPPTDRRHNVYTTGKVITELRKRLPPTVTYD